MKDEDIYLVENFRKGNIDSFETLVERYKERAYRVAYNILRNEEDALDVAQEAFVKIYKGIEQFKGGSTFYTWFYRIVVNLSLDKHRKNKSEKKFLVTEKRDGEEKEDLLERYAESYEYDPEKTYEISWKRDKITKALESLPEQQRMIVLLSDAEGLSYKEIAEILRCPEGTVMSRLFYARKKLREILSPLIGIIILVSLLSILMLNHYAFGQGVVSLRAQFILASNQPSQTPTSPYGQSLAQTKRKDGDPELRPLIGRLRQTLGYTYYELLDTHRLKSGISKTQKLVVPGGREMELTPRNIRKDRVEVEVKLIRGERIELNTVVGIPSGNTVFVGGPPFSSGVLIIAISAFID